MTEQTPYTPSVEQVRRAYVMCFHTPAQDRARAEFDRFVAIVRAEEREKYTPEDDERIARYMAMVTPMGYASALAVVDSMTALMNVEARANEIAEKARRDEREKCAQIADEVAREGNDYETAYCREIAARIRAQGEEQS